MKAKVKMEPMLREKVLLLHGIARVEDDWGEKDVEENLWVERSFLVNLIVWPVGNLSLELIEPSFVLKLFICAEVFCSLQLELVRAMSSTTPYLMIAPITRP